MGAFSLAKSFSLLYNGLKQNSDKEAKAMKQSQLCPKCGASDILFIPGNAGAYGAGNNIPAGATVFSYVKVNRYLCCRCGYSEEWSTERTSPSSRKNINQRGNKP
jgi:ribosomal protein S27AE